MFCDPACAGQPGSQGPGDNPDQDGHVDTVPFPLTACRTHETVHLENRRLRRTISSPSSPISASMICTIMEDGDLHFKNYANAVGWLAHEFGHRWGLALQFRNPHSGKIENLSNPDSPR